MKDVIVVYDDKLVRVPVKVWREVMDTMAEQMEDECQDYARSCGTPRKLREQTIPIFRKLRNVIY